MFKNFIRTLTLALACIIPAFGQSHYSTTATYSMADTGTNCQTTNCFIQTSTETSGTTVQLTGMSSGYDLSTFGYDAGGRFWRLPTNADGVGVPKWTVQNAMFLGPLVRAIAVRSATEIYAAFSVSGGTCGNVGTLYRWNGTQWTLITGCLDELSVGADGVLVGTNLNLQTSYYALNGKAPAWKVFSTAGRGWHGLVALNRNLGFGLVDNTAVYQVSFTGNIATILPGAAFSLSASGDGNLFAIGTDYNIYLMNFFAPTPTWVKLPPTGVHARVLAGNTSAGTFFLGGAGTLNIIVSNPYTTPFHYLKIGVMASVNIQGYFDCNFFVSGQCPSGSAHTATAKAAFPHNFGATGVGTAGPVPPANHLNATAVAMGFGCDPIFGDPTSPECVLSTGTGGVECSAMGAIVSQAAGGGGWWSHRDFEVAFTTVIYTGNKYGCHKDYLGTTWCDYSVADYCTLDSTPPDNSFNGQNINDSYQFAGWEVGSLCESVNVDPSGQGHQPWLCTYGFAEGIFTLNSRQECTSHP